MKSELNRHNLTRESMMTRRAPKRRLDDEYRAKYLHEMPAGAPTGWEYLTKLPPFVPTDRVLVHNCARPTLRRLGWHGFRAWLAIPDRRRLEVCGCDWAPELGRHFRVKRAWTAFRLAEAKAKSNQQRTATKRAKRNGSAPA
jgi:hypothetical protein